jgi:hypothetical protein
MISLRHSGFAEALGHSLGEKKQSLLKAIASCEF